MTDQNILYLVGVVIILLFFMWLGWRIRKAWKNFLFSRIRRRGQLGEENAIKILEKNGYQVVQSQVSFPGYMFVDDLKQEFDVRPDFIVEKDGLKYLAEVKTGDAALTKNRGTRRQLLEYTKVGNTDTVILVDATNGKVQKIRFSDYDDPP